MSSDPPSPTDPDEDWHQQPEKPDLSAAVTQLSKELEWMGLSGIDDGAPADEALGPVISCAYELIGVIRQLQRSKRQRDDHAQRLSHDLQRCQWLLERQRERCGEREREAADAREKQRQADVRLLAAHAALKKKTDQHRQLLRETQLKDNQWQHAMRRKDMEIERLQQQLLKVSSTKQHCLGPIEVDVRGSLTTQVSPPSGAGRRKRWDRVDESRNHRAIEDKWKLVVSGLEKEIETLRSGYVMLIDTVGAFLERTGHVEVPHSAKEWMQLPLSLIGPRLEAVFKALGDDWPATDAPSAGLADSHDSVREDEWLGHDAEVERWPHDEPGEWLFGRSEDALHGSGNESVRGDADLKLDNLKAAIKAAIRSVPSGSLLAAGSPPGGVEAIDPDAGRGSLVGSRAPECVSVTGRHHRAARRAPNQPSASRSNFYFQTL